MTLLKIKLLLYTCQKGVDKYILLHTLELKSWEWFDMRTKSNKKLNWLGDNVLFARECVYCNSVRRPLGTWSRSSSLLSIRCSLAWSGRCSLFVKTAPLAWPWRSFLIYLSGLHCLSLRLPFGLPGEWGPCLTSGERLTCWPAGVFLNLLWKHVYLWSGIYQTLH